MTVERVMQLLRLSCKYKWWTWGQWLIWPLASASVRALWVMVKTPNVVLVWVAAVNKTGCKKPGNQQHQLATQQQHPNMHKHSLIKLCVGACVRPHAQFLLCACHLPRMLQAMSDCVPELCVDDTYVCAALWNTDSEADMEAGRWWGEGRVRRGETSGNRLLFFLSVSREISALHCLTSSVLSFCLWGYVYANVDKFDTAPHSLPILAFLTTLMGAKNPLRTEEKTLVLVLHEWGKRFPKLWKTSV